MKWLLRGDVPSNKITPLYLPKQHMFPLEWVRASLWLKTSMQRAIFFLQGRPPPPFLIHSQNLARCNFLKNEKLFQQQVKRNFGSFTLMMCRSPAAIQRYVPLNWNSKIHEPISFEWVQTRRKCSAEQLHFYFKAHTEVTRMYRKTQ